MTPILTDEFNQSCVMQAPEPISQYEHPTYHLSREKTSDVQRQNLNVKMDLNKDIDIYLRSLENGVDVTNSLKNHKISPALRARMIDWMIEVLTNFRCDDQTFFLAISLMDRYFKATPETKEVSDLHITGVTAMFLGSKFEDIYPLKMKTVQEKIAHKKLQVQQIKMLELDMMQVIDYRIHAPTVLDFLKVYLLEVLGIQISNRTETKKKEEAALCANSTGSTLHSSPGAMDEGLDQDMEVGQEHAAR